MDPDDPHSGHRTVAWQWQAPSPATARVLMDYLRRDVPAAAGTWADTLSTPSARERVLMQLREN